MKQRHVEVAGPDEVVEHDEVVEVHVEVLHIEAAHVM
jgi:hypothetical protein